MKLLALLTLEQIFAYTVIAILFAILFGLFFSIFFWKEVFKRKDNPKSKAHDLYDHITLN